MFPARSRLSALERKFAVREMSQSALRDAWLSAPAGRLCPWQQARALALREASRTLHNGRTNLKWIASRVEKEGGGHPSSSAMCQFFHFMDNDPDWLPGKQGGAKRGRKPVLTPVKRRCKARSVMSSKHEGKRALCGCGNPRMPACDTQPRDLSTIL